MLNLILGSCGAGKSVRLVERLQDSIRSGQKVAVLLPEQFSFEGEKKLYDALGAKAFNAIETYSFMTLARELLSHWGSGHAGSYASDEEKLLYLWQAAQECAGQKLLTSLEKRVSSPEFILSLSGLVTKFRKSGVSPETLIAVSAKFPDRLARKTQDIGQILLAYDRILRSHEKNDSLVSLTEAAEVAKKVDFFQERLFFLDEFDSFTGDQYLMLRAMLGGCPDVTLAIRADDPDRRPTGIFDGGNRTVRRMEQMAKDAGISVQKEYLPHYRRSAYADLALAGTQVLRRHTQEADYQGHIKLVTAADPAAEAEYICAQICELLSQDRTLRCRDIAVAVKNPAVYNALLERAMIRYALPFDCSEPRSILHTDLTRHTLTLLDIVASKNWRTESMLRYVKSSFSGYDAERASMLEHFCFTYGIDGADWEKPFTSEEESLDMAKNFGDKRLELMRARLIKELSALKKACDGKNVRTVCDAVFGHLAKKKKAYEKALEDMTPVQRSAFAMIWNLLCGLLDVIVSSHGSEKLPIRRIYELFLLLVQSSTFSVPPATLDSIHIVDAQTARLDAPRILFVPGASEGEFPGEVSDTGMFSQQELRDLEAEKISISRLLPELHSDELMIVVKLLCAPSEQLYLTAPRVDQSGTSAAPSPVFDEIIALFPKAETLCIDADQLGVQFYVRTLASGYYTYVRHLPEDTPEMASLREILMQDPACADKLRKLVRKETPVQVSPEIMHEILGDQLILSPSGIETFHQCAFAYLCRYVLRLYVPEQIKLSYQSVGNFAHFCLEQILRTTPMQDFLTLDDNGLRALIDSYASQFSMENFPEAMRRSGRFALNYRAAGSSLLELLHRMQNEFRREEFQPMGFEVGVRKDPQDGEYPALSLDDGRILCVGKIDRVDVFSDEMTRLLRVVDYKTGDKSLTPEKLAFGLDMQMLLYLFALRQSGAFGDARASGVLYLPSGQLRQKSYESRTKDTPSREEILDSYYMARGLLTDEAVGHMDEKLRRSAAPVMTHRNKDTLFTLSQEQMEHLQTHVEKTVCTMADHLRSGDFTPAPRRLKDADPCAYCTFHDLCGFDTTPKPVSLSKEEKKKSLYEVFERKEQEDAELDTTAD